MVTRERDTEIDEKIIGDASERDIHMTFIRKCNLPLLLLDNENTSCYHEVNFIYGIFPRNEKTGKSYL